MVKQTFNPNAVAYVREEGRHRALQDLTVDEQYEVAKIIEFALREFGKDVETLTGGKFIMGPTKERETSDKKVERDLGGNGTYLTDVIRCKSVENSAAGILTARELADPEGDVHQLMRKHNAYSAIVSDHFAEPKFETGYRCLNCNIKFSLIAAIEKLQSMDPNELDPETLSALNNLNPEIMELAREYDAGTPDDDFLGVVIEWQVVHKALEENYKFTHGHMRAAQEIAGEYRNQRIPNHEAIRMAKHYEICKMKNGIASREGMLDVFLDDEQHAYTPEAEEHGKALLKM